MAFGLEIYSSSGVKTFDSTRYGGLFVEFMTITQATSGSKTYPQHLGRTLFGMHYFNGQNNLLNAWNCWSISHPAGTPTLTWNYGAFSGGIPVNLILFVK